MGEKKEESAGKQTVEIRRIPLSGMLLTCGGPWECLVTCSSVFLQETALSNET